MAFLNINIIGNDTAQVAVTNDATLEAVVNSLVANNITGSSVDFSVLIDDVVIFTDSVDANTTFRIPDKINIGANAILKVNAPTGLNVGVSYLQQALDVAGALSAAQLAAQAATDNGAVQVGLAADQVVLAEQAAADATTNGAVQVGLAADEVALANTAADRAEAALGTNSNPIITGSITEQVAVCDLSLEPDNGTVQTYTATADFTLTDGLADGQYLTLVLTVAGFTPTYPTVTWWEGAEPALGTTDKIFFEKIGSTLYGSQVASIV